MDIYIYIYKEREREREIVQINAEEILADTHHEKDKTVQTGLITISTDSTRQQKLINKPFLETLLLPTASAFVSCLKSCRVRPPQHSFLIFLLGKNK